MKECCVGAFSRVARLVALAAVGLTLSAGALLAQTTGKLEGRVRDQAGEKRVIDSFLERA